MPCSLLMLQYFCFLHLPNQHICVNLIPDLIMELKRLICHFQTLSKVQRKLCHFLLLKEMSKYSTYISKSISLLFLLKFINFLKFSDYPNCSRGQVASNYFKYGPKLQMISIFIARSFYYTELFWYVPQKNKYSKKQLRYLDI